MSNPEKLKVVELYTSKDRADDTVVSLLEQLLERAMNGEVDELCVVGVNRVTGESNRLVHQRSTTLIGAVSLVLEKMQREHNSCDAYNI